MDKIKQPIDFLVTDCGGDCNIMFLNMGVKKDKKLNCNAKVILGAENAISFENAENAENAASRKFSVM